MSHCVNLHSLYFGNKLVKYSITDTKIDLSTKVIYSYSTPAKYFDAGH